MPLVVEKSISSNRAAYIHGFTSPCTHAEQDRDAIQRCIRPDSAQLDKSLSCGAGPWEYLSNDFGRDAGCLLGALLFLHPVQERPTVERHPVDSIWTSWHTCTGELIRRISVQHRFCPVEHPPTCELSATTTHPCSSANDQPQFRRGASTLLMNSFLDGPTVLFASRTIKWYSNTLASPSQNTLDLFHLHNEKLHFDYTLHYLTTAHNPNVRKNVRRLLARRSKKATAAAFEEIQYAAARLNASYGDWQPLAPFTAVLRIAAASTNRTLVGTALCGSITLAANVSG